MNYSPLVCLARTSCLVVVFIAFLCVPREAAATPPEIVSVIPTANSHIEPLDTDITVIYDQAIDPTSVSPATMVVHSAQTGQLLDGVRLSAGAAVSFEPAYFFFPGDLVRTTMTRGIRNSIGQSAAHSFVWEFRTAVAPSPGVFTDSGQSLGDSDSYGVALGDLDGDGDLDAFEMNAFSNHKVWLNDGAGNYTVIGDTLENSSAFSLNVALGDLDGDGDLDAFMANANITNQVWINDGTGSFTDSGQDLGNRTSAGVALGDIDGDGDLDAFVACFYETEWDPVYRVLGNTVWINDGAGNFEDSGQNLGVSNSVRVALGDVDSDGDLDAVVANYSPLSARTKNRVWLNNGAGTFSDSGKVLGSYLSFDVVLGDLDGDGDLDALVTNEGSGDQVWKNNGAGVFTDSLQNLGRAKSFYAALGDADGDGDLDAVIADYDEGSSLWLNNGAGVFTDSGQILGGAKSVHPVLGDLDGDGDLDVFVGNDEVGNTVYLQINCEGDTDYDDDVDGVDLATLCADPGLVDLATFAEEFGGGGC